MKMSEVLLTFVGFHDPYHKSAVEGEELRGPILYLMGLRRFDRAYLFTAPNTYRIAEQTLEAIARAFPDVEARIVTLDITDPISYGQIIKGLRKAFGSISREDPFAQYSIATASGTPQMHASWLMLASSGEIPARILQARPPQFVSAERPAVEEIDLRAVVPGAKAVGGVLRPSAEAVRALARTADRGSRDAQRELRQELQIIGEHDLFLGALERAAGFAVHSSPILITGETGTGKELVARFVHRLSGRPVEKFIAVNCATLPASLAESLLFGHKKGAFTGAAEDQKGKFALADGGTLFLDEIGELPLEVQAKLLRVLQDGVVEPLGAAKGRAVKVRIVAASNHDLRQEVKEKRFREDLFYRIEIGTIYLPPLRERRSDIPLLAMWGIENINTRLKTPKRLSQEAIDSLARHDWPGNVRSLMNVIERAGMSVRKEVIEPADLQFSEGSGAPGGHSLPDPVEGFRMEDFIAAARKHLITRALEMANGSKTEASRLLGISPQAIHNYLRREAEEGTPPPAP